MVSITSLPMSTEAVPAAPISPFGLVGLSQEGVGECSIDSSFDSAVCSAGAGLEGRGLGGLAVLFDLVGDWSFPRTPEDPEHVKHHAPSATRRGDR